MFVVVEVKGGLFLSSSRAESSFDAHKRRLWGGISSNAYSSPLTLCSSPPSAVVSTADRISRANRARLVVNESDEDEDNEENGDEDKGGNPLSLIIMMRSSNAGCIIDESVKKARATEAFG